MVGRNRSLLTSATREIELTIRTIRRLLALGAVLAGVFAYPAFAWAAPSPVQAFYMYGSTPAGVITGAGNDGCAFAANQPDFKTDIMLLDFGAARIIGSAQQPGTIDFSGTLITNSTILRPASSRSPRSTVS